MLWGACPRPQGHIVGFCDVVGTLANDIQTSQNITLSVYATLNSVGLTRLAKNAISSQFVLTQNRPSLSLPAHWKQQGGGHRAMTAKAANLGHTLAALDAAGVLIWARRRPGDHALTWYWAPKIVAEDFGDCGKHAGAIATLRRHATHGPFPDAEAAGDDAARYLAIPIVCEALA